MVVSGEGRSRVCDISWNLFLTTACESAIISKYKVREYINLPPQKQKEWHSFLYSDVESPLSKKVNLQK